MVWIFLWCLLPFKSKINWKLKYFDVKQGLKTCSKIPKLHTQIINNKFVNLTVKINDDSKQNMTIQTVSEEAKVKKNQINIHNKIFVMLFYQTAFWWKAKLNLKEMFQWICHSSQRPLAPVPSFCWPPSQVLLKLTLLFWKLSHKTENKRTNIINILDIFVHKIWLTFWTTIRHCFLKLQVFNKSVFKQM